MHWCIPELLIKGTFLSLTVIYATVTYRDTQDRSPSNPSYTEWDVCWPVATWYISWHAAICLSVVSLPSRLFRIEADDLAGQNIPQGPDWYRLTILFIWYLAGIPTAFSMYDTCTVGAPGTWARGIRVFIEGVVAFGLGGFIYGLGRCLFPVYHSRPVLLPYPAEKVSSRPAALRSGSAAEFV
jgi:hypothetical protein